MAASEKFEQNRKTRVFISYSRKNGEFAEQLRDALISRGFEAYLDKHDIAPGEPWQDRLSGLITTADTIVFCLSPHFVASDICDWEVNEAERLGKRLLPSVAVNTPDDAVPGRLKCLNYIFMRDELEFAAGIEKLVAAINTDVSWVREHTRLIARTQLWLRKKGDTSLLLRGEELRDANLLRNRFVVTVSLSSLIPSFGKYAEAIGIVSKENTWRVVDPLEL